MTRQNHKILSILSVLLSVYYPIVIGRLHVWLCSASPTVINVGLTNKDPVVAFLWNNCTGCPAKLLTLLFFEFLGVQGV